MKLHVHVHDSSGASIGGELETKRKRTKFDGPLIERFLARFTKHFSTDEASGHKFHGNQWTGGLGSKPEVPATGSVKEKLAHLLAQGHSFTMEELIALLGQNKHTIRGRLSEMKNATLPGELYLAKQGKHYFLAKKAENEAPFNEETIEVSGGEVKAAMAEAEAEKEPFAGWNAEAAEAAYAEKVAAHTPEPVKPAPEPVVEPEPAQTTAEKLLPEPAEFTPDADKAQKNAVYDQALKKWADDLSSSKFKTKEGIEPETIDALAKGFKQNKTNAMAQWKSTTDGVTVKAKDADVYKADSQYVKDILAGKSHADAYAAWKKNTVNEKAGTWPPDPLAEQKKLAAQQSAAEALAAKSAEYAANQAKAKLEAEAKAQAELAALGEALKEHGPHFPVVTDYMPADHVGIGAEDFVGGANSSFVKQFGQFNAKLRHGHSDSHQNKIDVQKAIEDRLASSKSFQAMQAQSKSKNKYGSLAATLISAWAGSSGDHHPLSVANQLSIRDAFGMEKDSYSLGAMKGYLAEKSEDQAYADAAAELGCHYNTPATKATFRSGMRDFALAQYHNTQDHLKKLGITELSVARGSGGASGVVKEDAAATHGKYHGQPASSFSTNFQTAYGFSKSDSIYMVKVPASQVLGTYVTGYGCTGEYEVCLLAHPDTQAVRTKPITNVDTAASHVEKTMKNAPAPSAHALAEMEHKKALAHAAAHKASLIEAKAGGPAPVVPKYSKYSKSPYSKTAYTAAKKGDVEEVKKIKAAFEAFKTSKGLNYYYTTPYMNEIVEHAEKVAAHKEATAKAKKELAAEAKAAKAKEPKVKKKPIVHVHIHEQPEVKSAAGFGDPDVLAGTKYAAVPEPSAAIKSGLVNSNWSDPEHQKLWSNFLASGGENWIKSHSHYNEAKYQQMIKAGKTPIQIKHYLGSIKHAAAKKTLEAA